MIETRRLKNVVIFIQTSLRFVLSRNIMFLFSKLMRLTTFNVIFLLMLAVFHRFQENTSCGIIQPHSLPFDVFVILIG